MSNAEPASATATSSSQVQTQAEPTSFQSTAPDTSASTNAASKLAEAIDDFLGDLEKKFKGISEEVLNKLDDMAERCDRLEAELGVKEDGGGN